MNLSKFHKRLAKKDEFPMYIRVPLLTLSSWLFQGILYMDTTERVFKILLDVLFFFPLYLAFRPHGSPLLGILIAFILAHTLNWIFNGQIPVLLKNLRLIKTEYERFEKYLDTLKKKVEKNDSILYAAAFGSLSRGELKGTSDLDVRLIRKPGFINGLRACIFIMKERSWATFNKFPLDIYVGDSMEFLKKMREDERAQIIKNTNTA